MSNFAPFFKHMAYQNCLTLRRGVMLRLFLKVRPLFNIYFVAMLPVFLNSVEDSLDVCPV